MKGLVGARDDLTRQQKKEVVDSFIEAMPQHLKEVKRRTDI